jgi:hypothetical protein
MNYDPSRFQPVNIADTCAIWNVLSSNTLYQAAASANCVFSITACVMYECLHKARNEVRAEDEELKARLRSQMVSKAFQQHPVSLEALQDPRVLGLRKNLGKGEVSVIAFALETGQAIMTDDQGARRQAERQIGPDRVQTTPRLLCWLFYTNCLGDADKDVIIAEHEALGPKIPLSKYFKEMYFWALQCRLQSRPDASAGTDGVAKE